VRIHGFVVNYRQPNGLCRVAVDRGLRLADKRSLPCPRRLEWLAARDFIYEEIMSRAWNPVGRFFGQSYEEPDVVDSAVLIMPLVFFSSEVRLQSARGVLVQALTILVGGPEIYQHASSNPQIACSWRLDFQRLYRHFTSLLSHVIEYLPVHRTLFIDMT
jgi:hypothetical protein